MKLQVPLHDFQASASIRKQIAVTSFDFSDCDSYLQMCLQTVNHENIVDTQTYAFGENNIFVIWDV